MKFDNWLSKTPEEAVASGQLLADHLMQIAAHILLGLVMTGAAWIAHRFVLQRNSGAGISYIPIAIEIGLAIIASTLAGRLVRLVMKADEIHVIAHCVIAVVFAGTLVFIAWLDVVPVFVGY